jgi:branched-chain amino acid aminotransferase
MKILEDELEVEVTERDIALGELLTADEAFFTGTAAEITPIVEVDGIKIGNGRPGPLTRKLQSLYEDIVRGKIERYREWLTYV